MPSSPRPTTAVGARCCSTPSCRSVHWGKIEFLILCKPKKRTSCICTCSLYCICRWICFECWINYHAPLAASCLVSDLKSYLRDGVVAPAPLVLGSHRQQERSFPAAVSMAAGPSSPLVLPSDQVAPSPSPRRHKENSESLDPTPLPSHGDPWWDICTNLSFRC